MAPARKRYQPRKRHYRCERCRTLVPTGYLHCGSCGFNRDEWETDMIADIKRIFPGTRELSRE